MSVGNAKYNMLYNPKEKHYISYSNEIDIADKNNSHSLVLNSIDYNSKVLDIGCSFGYMGEWLVKNKNCRVYGIDIDSKGIEFIKKTGIYEKADCIDLDKVIAAEGEDEKLFNSFPNDFDYIICADLLEHLKDPTSILMLLGRKLKYKGKIVVSIPNIANIDVLLNLLEGRFNYSDYGLMDNTHLKFFTLKSFAEWIYSINTHSKEYLFDLKHEAVTRFIPEYTQEIRLKYPEIVEELLKLNPELENLQNIFILTKRTLESELKLNSFIKGYKKNYKYKSINEIPVRISEPITKKNYYKYLFTSTNNNWCGMEILMGTFMEKIKGKLVVEIIEKESAQKVLTKEIDILDYKDNSWLKVDFDRKLNSLNVIYIIKVAIKDTDQSIAVWTNEDNEPCFRLLFFDEIFDIETAEEEHKAIKNLCDIVISSKKNDSLSSAEYGINNSSKELIKLKNENKRLKLMVKELLEEMVN